jgi:hypothetical protein
VLSGSSWGFLSGKGAGVEKGVEASQDATANVENLMALIMVLSKEKKVLHRPCTGSDAQPKGLDQPHWWIRVHSQCGSGL